MTNNQAKPEDDFVDAEVLHFEIRKDLVSNILWKMKTGTRIRVGDMEDSHLRNTVLFLTDFGYQHCVAPTGIRLKWLTIFRMEWNKRLASRSKGIKVRVRVEDMLGLTS